MSLKRTPIKAEYRIKQSSVSKKLEPLPQSRSMPPNKLKPYLRYSGEKQPVEQKTVLLNTVIEEHLLKFGLIDTFDSFIKEVAEKVQAKAFTETKIQTAKEIQDQVMDVK
jgi:hypothetical protein